jgi:transcription termination/antitermination protein NusA
MLFASRRIIFLSKINKPHMFDLKTIQSVLDQLKEERGIPKEKILEAIEAALATAYRKEFGKRGQLVRAHFDMNTGKVEFMQVKVVVAPEHVIYEDDPRANEELPEGFTVWNPEQNMLIADAQRIKKDAKEGDEIVFPLEHQDDFGRIASQTAKQVIIQKIREAEKVTVFGEYGKKEGEIVSGLVQRIDRGQMFIEMGRALGVMPFEEQIRGERYRQGEKIRAYLYKVEDTPRGVFLRLSRAHPQFLEKLFETEAPEVASGAVEIKAVAREAGSRSKIAVHSKDSHIDPVGAMVGQRGVRVSTVMSELGGEKIDIIEWSEDPKKFIEDALSPARVVDVTLDEVTKSATVDVSEDQQSLAIGRGGQNVRLAAKLTGWKIDIRSVGGEVVDSAEKETEKEVTTPTFSPGESTEKDIHGNSIQE